MTRPFLTIVTLAATALAVACGSDDMKDSQSSPAGNAQGVASVVPLTTSTPEVRLATPAATATAGVASSPAPGTPAPSPTPGAGGTPSVSSSSSGSTVTVPFPFENALQARASLLGNARFGAPMDPFDSSDPLDLKAYPGWAAVYPTLRLTGYGNNATPQSVSVYRGLLDSKSPGSASNPKVIAFTAMDNKSVCAGGVIRGWPTYAQGTQESVDIGSSPCNAQSVLNVLRR